MHAVCMHIRQVKEDRRRKIDRAGPWEESWGSTGLKSHCPRNRIDEECHKCRGDFLSSRTGRGSSALKLGGQTFQNLERVSKLSS